MEHISLDIEYDIHIKNINKNSKNKNLINQENNGLFEFWKNICKLNNSISTRKGKINVITTNHCNTIESYFKIHECINLKDLDKFKNKDLAILKLHNFNENEKIYDIDGYYKFFSDNYLQRLFELFQKISNSGANLIIIFGSSYFELHINSLLREIIASEKNNKIVWMINIADVINKSKIYTKEIINKIEEMTNEYDQKRNHIILFSSLDDMNKLWNEINIKLNDLIPNKLTFEEILMFEGKLKNAETSVFKLSQYIISNFKEMLKNKEKEIEILDAKLNNKDYSYIATIVYHFFLKTKMFLVDI